MNHLAGDTPVAAPRESSFRLRSGSEGIVAIGMLAVVVTVVAPNLLASSWVYDGGIAASAGTFMLHGSVPYRDFWLLYGPLGGIVVAVPTAVLGPSILLIKTLGFLMVVGQARLGYLISRLWASPLVAAVVAISAVIMLPPIMGLELSAWPLAMLLALAAIYFSIGTNRSGLLVGFLVGLSFLARLDVGAYTLFAVLLVRDRRLVLTGFGAVAIPFGVVALAVAGVGPLLEQLIWYPLVGQPQFRSLSGADVAQVGSAGPIIAVPLILIPRALIAGTLVGVAWLTYARRPVPHGAAVVAVAVFAGLCQLQTLVRVDLDHLAEAATPAILLLAVWCRNERLDLPHFALLAGVVAACAAIGLLGFRVLGAVTPSAIDVEVRAISAWVRDATEPDEPLFVGLTSHRFAVQNPMIVYYLADRRPAVRDTMFNPGLTNTDPVQMRMIADLERTAAPYLVLQHAEETPGEQANQSRIPGSIALDTFISANYHTACDFKNLVIKVRNGLGRPVPPCPELIR